MKNIIKRHKKFIAWYQEKLSLSNYQLLWLVFFKGVVITIVIQKIF